MGGDDCNAAIQQNFNESYTVFQAGLDEALQSTSLGDAQNTISALNTYAQSMLDGTYHTNSNFDQQSWDWWKNWWYYYTRDRDGFKNIKQSNSNIIEPMDNINTIGIIDSAILVRHQALRATNSFTSDCRNNVDNVMSEFKTQETSDFNKLEKWKIMMKMQIL